MFAIYSLAALGEVSSRMPLSSSTFADVIHAERLLEKESCGALRRIHDGSPCGKTVNINTGPAASLSVTRSYRLISSFHCFRFFQPPIRVDCSFARPEGSSCSISSSLVPFGPTAKCSHLARFAYPTLRFLPHFPCPDLCGFQRFIV